MQLSIVCALLGVGCGDSAANGDTGTFDGDIGDGGDPGPDAGPVDAGSFDSGRGDEPVSFVDGGRGDEPVSFVDGGRGDEPTPPDAAEPDAPSTPDAASPGDAGCAATSDVCTFLDLTSAQTSFDARGELVIAIAPDAPAASSVSVILHVRDAEDDFATFTLAARVENGAIRVDTAAGIPNPYNRIDTVEVTWTDPCGSTATRRVSVERVDGGISSYCSLS